MAMGRGLCKDCRLMNSEVPMDQKRPSGLPEEDLIWYFTGSSLDVNVDSSNVRDGLNSHADKMISNTIFCSELFRELMLKVSFTVTKAEIVLDSFSEYFRFSRINLHPVGRAWGFHLLQPFGNACKRVISTKSVSKYLYCAFP